MTGLLGRCYDPNKGVKYLVEWEGYVVWYVVFLATPRILHRYGLHECTWEPVENFSNDLNMIKAFRDSWIEENPGVDFESIDLGETLLLNDASNLARAGITWNI